MEKKNSPPQRIDKSSKSSGKQNFSRREFVIKASAAATAFTIIPGQLLQRSMSTVPSGFHSSWDPPSDYKSPQWFRNAKFGLWLHWGPQTIPAKGGGWYARHMYVEPKNLGQESWGKEAWAYHRETYGHQSEFGYKDLCNLWKAEKFNADDTIRQFKKWGAHYVATMANHHDNFDLFNSTVHGWNTTKVGPKRDLLGEFAAAARRENLKWMASVHSSRSNKWFKPAFGSDSEGAKKGVPYDGNQTRADGKGKWWEGLDPQQLYACKYEAFEKELSQRHLELVVNYRPDVLYFDDGQIPEPMKEACARLYNDSLTKYGSIQTIITVKQPQPGTVLDYEKGVADSIRDDYWQTDTTLAEDWFLKPNPDGSSAMRHNARSLKELLVDIVSKRGVLMLNIAVRADGTVPQDQVVEMNELGAWLQGNGEAIYNTHPWKVYGEGGAASGGAFKERGISSVPWNSDVQRFTCNKDNKTLYVHLFGDPSEKEITISSLAKSKGLFNGKIVKVSLIGQKGRITGSVHDKGLIINMPPKLAFRDCNVLKVETSGL